MTHAPQPLFRDPIYDGAADPTIIWNYQEHNWWILYTNRRANQDAPGYAWVHGTDIGIASSFDSGQTWRYRGTLAGLEFERGRNTFWAPEIIWHAGLYHMFVSYVPGVPHDWSGKRLIIHYTSANLWDWHFEAVVPLSSERVIDACLYQLPSGSWRMWYKDEADGSHIYQADSIDVYNWQVAGAVLTDHAQEGPNVFRWHGYYWLIADAWKGLEIYRSEDADHWDYATTLLAAPGKRIDDGWIGQHADVLVQADRAYIFYFTHPQRGPAPARRANGVEPYHSRRTSLQVAELGFDGSSLTCDRDLLSDFALAPGE